MPWLGICFLLVGSIGGIFFVPMDYQQGESFKIIFVHVPCAWAAMGIYGLMVLGALLGLSTKSLYWHLRVLAIAPIGLVFTILSITSGAIWGSLMWGTYWVWDARLTSMLLLALLYLGFISINKVIEKHKRLNSLLIVVLGGINLPIIKWSVEWWATLHQGATFFRSNSITLSMSWPMIFMTLGIAIYTSWLYHLNVAYLKKSYSKTFFNDS